jgi:hypothetical protein
VSKKLAELGPHNGLAMNGVDHFLIRLFLHYSLSIMVQGRFSSRTLDATIPRSSFSSLDQASSAIEISNRTATPNGSGLTMDFAHVA